MVQSIPAHMINEVMATGSNVLTPEVGMLGTYHVGSDRYAVVVCKVYSPKRIFIQFLRGNNIDNIEKTVVNGIEFWKGNVNSLMAENAPKYNDRYGEESASIFAYENARYIKEGTYTLRKNGRWVEAGRGLWEPGAIHLGVADPYLDPCF